MGHSSIGGSTDCPPPPGVLLLEKIGVVATDTGSRARGACPGLRRSHALGAIGDGMDLSLLHFLIRPDADGVERRLGSFWEERPAILVFLRHFG